MTRRLRTIVVLAVEAVLLAGMLASFVYFTRNSRDVVLTHPEAAVPGPSTAG